MNTFNNDDNYICITEIFTKKTLTQALQVFLDGIDYAIIHDSINTAIPQTSFVYEIESLKRDFPYLEEEVEINKGDTFRFKSEREVSERRIEHKTFKIYYIFNKTKNDKNEYYDSKIALQNLKNWLFRGLLPEQCRKILEISKTLTQKEIETLYPHGITIYKK